MLIYPSTPLPRIAKKNWHSLKTSSPPLKILTHLTCMMLIVLKTLLIYSLIILNVHGRKTQNISISQDIPRAGGMRNVIGA